MRAVNSAKGPDSSVGGVPVGNCLDVDHMEEEVQVRVQVEVEREEQGKARNRESNTQTHDMDDHEYEVMRTNTFLSHDVSVHHEVCALCKSK